MTTTVKSIHANDVSFDKSPRSHQQSNFSQIPFPAVTICPEWKTNSELFNLTECVAHEKQAELMRNSDLTVLEVLSQICDFPKPRQGRYFTTEGKYLKKLFDVRLQWANISSSTFTLGKNTYDTKTYFKETFTEVGFCYTFNMLDYKDLYKSFLSEDLRYPKVAKRSSWNVFTGYKTDSDYGDYPMRVKQAGVSAGLQVKVAVRKIDKDQIASCGKANGFRVVVHAPDEVPRPKERYYRVLFNTEALIKILPKVVKTSDKLKSYNPKQRQCFLRGEKRLKFFKHYNQDNCLVECATGENELIPRSC